MAQEQEISSNLKGWTYPGVFVMSLILFLILMGIETSIYQKFSHISHIGIIVVSLLAAFKVRLNDSSAAIWAPPIVWLVGLLTVGQIGRARTEFTLKSEIFHVGYGLANHALWVVLATVLAWAVVVVRRARH